MTKWEYMTARDLDRKEIDDLGKGGWEMCAAVHRPSRDENGCHFPTAIIFWFKRALP